MAQQKQQHQQQRKQQFGRRRRVRGSCPWIVVVLVLLSDGLIATRGEWLPSTVSAPTTATSGGSRLLFALSSAHRPTDGASTAWKPFTRGGCLKSFSWSLVEGLGKARRRASSAVRRQRETRSGGSMAAMTGTDSTGGQGDRVGDVLPPRNTKGRPPSLPQGEFRPKQSLGQNYLADQNYVLKICNHFGDTSERGRRVVELGPGTGALTQVLHKRFPDMLAVDIDQRAIELLEDSMPSLSVVMSDVLQVDYTKLAELRGGTLSVIGNLPYHITSQILFTLCDHYRSVRRAVVTMQLEVAQRVIAKPGTKQYGILSVVFQLYARPQVLFHIPPTVFYPQPSVTSALISLDFTGKGPGVDQSCLKRVLSSAFQQRRKMLRQSLKPLLSEGQTLPEEFATKRPEQLQPGEFVTLTKALFGESGELPQGSRTWRGLRNPGGRGEGGGT